MGHTVYQACQALEIGFLKIAYYFFIDVIGEHASGRDEIDQMGINR
jgi:hypothetical protein